MIALAHEEKERFIHSASIKVVGVGGAGGNTIDRMSKYDCTGIELIAINTDAQALQKSCADVIIHIGQKSTKGLGAGANPEVGKKAAEEDLDKVLEVIGNADIVFLTGGMGGGTGSGALPTIVQALKEKNILTIVVVTKPFSFEGKRRATIAEQAVEKVRQNADTLIIVPNQKLLDLVDDKVSMIEGFEMINEILNQSVRGISDIITKAGHINVDFADVREIMKNQGLAVMGTGNAMGEGRAKKAALAAISSPLLENMSIAGARGVLLNIAGSSSLGLHEISAAASVIYEQADENANIILGSVIDDNLGDTITVTVIATGFKEMAKQMEQAHFIPQAKSVVAEQPHIVPHVAFSEKEVIRAASMQDASMHTEESSKEKVIEGVYYKESSSQVELQKEEVNLREQQVYQEQRNHVERSRDGLGSNKIQLKDYDVPAFMRKDHNNHKYNNKFNRHDNRNDRRQDQKNQKQESVDRSFNQQQSEK